jgi:DNA-binding NarL/FixJ family response regulator
MFTDGNAGDKLLCLIDMLKIVLAEDHAAVRSLIRINLKQDGHFKVIAETGNGIEAIELVEKLHPDVLVIDIRLPGLDGIQAIQKVKAVSPLTEVIVMSMYDDDVYVYNALAAGARGYVVKSGLENLPEAITAVNDGHIYLTPPVSLDRIKQYQRDRHKPPLDYHDLGERTE